jgi:hypothetical protein
VSRPAGVHDDVRAPALALLALLALLAGLVGPPWVAGTALAATGSKTASTPSTSTSATTTPAAASTPLNVPGTTSPFSPGLPETPAETATATTPTVTSASSSPGGGVSGSTAIAIAVGAIVVLIGVALFIWTDARRHAPVKPGAGGAGSFGGRSGSKAPPKSRKLSPAERRRRKRGRAR